MTNTDYVPSVRRLLIIALAAIVGFFMAACPGPNDPIIYKKPNSPPPQARSSVYYWTDDDSNEYNLTITENSGARSAIKAGSFTLVVSDDTGEPVFQCSGTAERGEGDEIKFTCGTGESFSLTISGDGDSITVDVGEEGIKIGDFTIQGGDGVIGVPITWYVPPAALTYVPDDYINDLWVQKEFVEMKVGDTPHRINPKRVPEVIGNETANEVRAPQFHYELVHGEGVVEMTPVEVKGGGYYQYTKFDTVNVKALKPGVAVIKIRYDWMTKNQPWNISGGVNNAFTDSNDEFGACSEVNYMYVVFSVADGTNHGINISVDTGGLRFPYDTVYFTGDSRNWDINVAASGADTVEVTLNGTVIDGNGKYTLPLKNMNNLVGVKASNSYGTKIHYEVIRARKVVAVTNPEQPAAGQSFVIKLKGLTPPLYKLAGIYNPQKEGCAVYAGGLSSTNFGQWNLAKGHGFTTNSSTAGTRTYTGGGHIQMRWYGDAVGMDKDRYMVAMYSGNAPTLNGSFSVMPTTFSVTVYDALPGNVTVTCTGTPEIGETLTAAYSGSENVTWQWNRNGTAIEGATGNTYYLDKAGSYTVTARSAHLVKTSSTVNVANLTLSGNVTVTPSGTVDINTTLTADYDGDEEFGYEGPEGFEYVEINWQWKRNNLVIEGETGTTYTPAVGGEYTVTASVENYSDKTSAPVTVIDPSGAALTLKTVSAANGYTMAIDNNGHLWGWGTNTNGRIGNGNTNAVNNPTMISAGNWESVYTSARHTAAITTSGDLYTWGSRDRGRLGDGQTSGNVTTPTRVTGGSTVGWKFAAVGGDTSTSTNTNTDHSVGYTVAIDNDGYLWAWGANRNGQLGLGNTDDQSTPVQVGEEKWKSVACVLSGFTGQPYHVTVGIKEDGTLWIWGHPLYLPPGNGSPERLPADTNKLNLKTSPEQLTNAGDGWKSVSGGYNVVLLLKDDNTLWSWGVNGTTDWAATGHAGTAHILAPTKIGNDTWKCAFAACPSGASANNNATSAGIKTDGTLWIWGTNADSSMGHVGANATPTQVHIGEGQNGTEEANKVWKSVSVGRTYFMLIRNDNTLHAFGNGGNMQLGTGNTANQAYPVMIDLE